MKNFYGVLVLVVALISGCSQPADLSDGTLPPSVTANHQAEITGNVIMQPSWAYGHSDMEDLIGRSGLVVLGRVTKTLSVEDVAKNGVMVLPVTFYEFAIEKVLLCTLENKPGSIITVYKSGGVFAGRDYQVPGYPPYNPGEQVVLFLKAGEPEGCYYAHPQGRFVVDNGFVHTLKHLDKENGFVIPGYTSTELSQFIQRYFPDS